MIPEEPDRIPDAAAADLLSFLMEDEKALRLRLQNEGVELDLPTDDAPDVQWYGLLGNALWKVFSDNNEVVSPDGRTYDLGSWRGGGDFIARFLNARLADEGLAGASPRTDRPFNYLDFYMGLVGGPDELLRPLYVHIFKRLKARGCTWRYAPPAIYLFQFNSPGEDRDDEDPSAYDPGAVILDGLREQEDEAHENAVLRDLSEGNEEVQRRAVDEPPQVVLAYRDVYGEMPPYLRHDER
ncbi:MAG: hypothetical protein ABJF88_08680 [Rhodothermales bacterium]